mgnify:CR=1 FL=1
MPIPASLMRNLRLPVVTAPMLLVSDPNLVLSACRAGVIGTFPSLNQRGAAGYEQWLDTIEAGLGPDDAAYGVNLIVSKANDRLDSDLAITVRRRVPLVITSFGADRDVVKAVHGYGGIVFHDIASIRHAEVAAAAGVDGLILLTAGAGGHTGWLNPFAILNEVRAMFGGTILLAGALSTGRDIAAARMAGADLAYMGTRFIATRESAVDPAYRAMLVEARAADVQVTRGISGTPASFLTPSMIANGLDPLAMASATLAVKDVDGRAIKPWKEIWSAGQGVGSIADIPSVTELVGRLGCEYSLARQDFISGPFA